MYLNGLKLSGALKEFSITSQVLGSKMQKLFFFFFLNKGFECSIFRIEVQVVSNPSSRLEQTPKHLNFSL